MKSNPYLSKSYFCHSGLDPESRCLQKNWIPAFAGMTTKGYEGNLWGGAYSRFTIRGLRSEGCDSRLTIHDSRFFTEKGFTLLEVLVAVAITSIVIAALYSTFFLSRKAIDTVDDSLVKMQEGRAVVDVIRREIEAAVYDSQKISGGKAYTMFKLDDRDFYGKQASQLTFTAFSPLIPGLAKITYTVEEKDGRLSLKKKIASAYAQTAEAKDTEMIEDIESFAVEAKYNDKWVKTWESSVSNNKLDEIRITIKIHSKKQIESERDQSKEGLFTISDIARPRYGKTL